MPFVSYYFDLFNIPLGVNKNFPAWFGITQKRFHLASGSTETNGSFIQHQNKNRAID